MGRKHIPGLLFRDGIWHVDKRIYGRRVCQSTGTADIQEAETYLARLMEETRQAQVYGVRPTRTFEQAAAKFVMENQHKRSIADDAQRLKDLMPSSVKCHWSGFIWECSNLGSPTNVLGAGRLEPSTMVCRWFVAF
jgi:hypothetical protein